MQTAIITGCTGAIGTALCRLLTESGAEVYAVIRPDSTRRGALPAHPRLHITACDASRLSELPALLPDVRADAFFHFAWANTIGAGRNDMPSQIQNIQNTVDAVRAAAALGCEVFVGAGSQAEYGRAEGVLRPDTPPFPENGYGMAKLCAGQMSRAECRRLGLRHIWARVLSVYGPRDGKATMISTVIRALLAGERPALTPGGQLWDYLYSEDAAEAFYRMALYGKDGCVYPLGSGCARPLREYIETLRDTIDPALPLGFGELPYGAQQVMHLEADVSALERDTGWQCRTPFSAGIKNTIDWVKANDYGK